MLFVSQGLLHFLKFSLGEICLSEALGKLGEALQTLIARGQLDRHSCREGVRLHSVCIYFNSLATNCQAPNMNNFVTGKSLRQGMLQNRVSQHGQVAAGGI